MKISNLSINEKKPLFSGFFSFIFIAFSELLTLQIFARCFLYLYYFKSKLFFVDLIQCSIHGLKQDISITSYFVLFAVVVLLLLNFFKANIQLKFTLYFLTIAGTFICFISLLDSQLLYYWNNKTDFQFLFYLQFPKEAFNTLSIQYWLFFILILVIVFFGIYGLNKFIFHKINLKFNVINYKLLLPLIFLLVTGIRGGWGLMPILISDASFSDNREKNLLATNSVWNFFYQLSESSGMNEIEDFRNGKYLNPNLDNLYFRDSYYNSPLYYWDKPPNVVLIVLEGFTAELSSYFGGHDGDCMPFIDSLAKNGYSCTQMYATGDRTDKGLLSILSGWPGQTWQNMINHPSKLNKIPALAKQFSKMRGYKSTFYYGGSLDFANMELYLKQNGFENLKSENEISKFTQHPKGKWGYPDKVLFDFFANEQLKNDSHDFEFSTLLTLSSHEPFDIAPNNLKTENEKMQFCVRYTDNQLRNFFSKIQKSSNFKNTIFVITADHGKELNTASTLFGSRNFFHIPFLIYGNPLPSELKGYKNNQVVSQVDIYQSLHELFLQIPDKRAIFSRSIFRKIHPKNAISNLTGATVYIDSLTYNYLPTDKLSISKKVNLNRHDSLLLHLQTKIINFFLN